MNKKGDPWLNGIGLGQGQRGSNHTSSQNTSAEEECGWYQGWKRRTHTMERKKIKPNFYEMKISSFETRKNEYIKKTNGDSAIPPSGKLSTDDFPTPSDKFPPGNLQGRTKKQLRPDPLKTSPHTDNFLGSKTSREGGDMVGKLVSKTRFGFTKKTRVFTKTPHTWLPERDRNGWNGKYYFNPKPYGRGGILIDVISVGGFLQRMRCSYTRLREKHCQNHEAQKVDRTMGAGGGAVGGWVGGPGRNGSSCSLRRIEVGSEGKPKTNWKSCCRNTLGPHSTIKSWTKSVEDGGALRLTLGGGIFVGWKCWMPGVSNWKFYRCIFNAEFQSYFIWSA